MQKRNVIFIMIAGFIICAQWVAAQQPLQPVVKDTTFSYLNEKIIVVGTVAQYIKSDQKTTSYYLLKDDYGTVMPVRTSEDKPSTKKRVEIEGVVTFDPDPKNIYGEAGGFLFISELKRTILP